MGDRSRTTGLRRVDRDGRAAAGTGRRCRWCAQQVRPSYHQPSHRERRAPAEHVPDSFETCPIPEVARLG